MNDFTCAIISLINENTGSGNDAPGMTNEEMVRGTWDTNGLGPLAQVEVWAVFWWRAW